jgi:hypothetical protein
VHACLETGELNDLPKRNLAPPSALAVVAQRARELLCGRRGLLLQERDRAELLGERLGIALALLAQGLHERFLLGELFLQRLERGIDGLLAGGEILLGELLLPLELILGLLEQLLGAGLEHLGAGGLEGGLQLVLRVREQLSLLAQVAFALGEFGADGPHVGFELAA